MAHSFATYEGEELMVTFKGSISRTDYGVQGSPTWSEVTDVEIEELCILGIPVEPSALSNEALNAIHNLSDEVSWDI